MPLPANATLVLIDVQQAFDDPVWGERNNPQAEANVAALLAAWRASGRPVIHVQHRSARADSLFHPAARGFPFKPEALPLAGEPVVFKSVNSGFIGTDLEVRLRAAGSPPLVIAGITTDQCVSTTTRMANNLGFDAHIVHDACATFERVGHDGRRFSAQLMHDAGIASLHGEFAQAASTQDVLAML